MGRALRRERAVLGRRAVNALPPSADHSLSITRRNDDYGRMIGRHVIPVHKRCTPPRRRCDSSRRTPGYEGAVAICHIAPTRSRACAITKPRPCRRARTPSRRVPLSRRAPETGSRSSWSMRRRTRTAPDTHTSQRRDRQLLSPVWRGRHPPTRLLPRHQARCPRPYPKAPRWNTRHTGSHQRRLPRTIEAPMVADMITKDELSIEDAVANQPVGRGSRR